LERKDELLETFYRLNNSELKRKDELLEVFYHLSNSELERKGKLNVKEMNYLKCFTA